MIIKTFWFITSKRQTFESECRNKYVPGLTGGGKWDLFLFRQGGQISGRNCFHRLVLLWCKARMLLLHRGWPLFQGGSVVDINITTTVTLGLDWDGETGGGARTGPTRHRYNGCDYNLLLLGFVLLVKSASASGSGGTHRLAHTHG